MRVLHVTHRFGADVAGGAERYLYMLSRELVRRGVEVDVFTTRTRRLGSLLRFGARWDDELSAGREDVDGIHVHRFGVKNLPQPLVQFLCRSLERRWDREEPEAAVVDAAFDGRAVLGPGWHLPERNGEKVMRWTRERAAFFADGDPVTEIQVVACSPGRARAEVRVNGARIGDLDTDGEWRRFSFPVRVAGRLRGEIVCPTWQPRGDPRRLGIAVAEIGWVAGGIPRTLRLDDDYKLHLSTEALASHYRSRVEKRPWHHEAAFFLLRAPLSAGLVQGLARRAAEYDVILGQMTPYGTLNYAAYFGRRAGVPVVLLPHFHLEDDFYHWRQYYSAFQNAAAVLAFTELSRKVFFDEIGAKSVIVPGGGVDPEEFADDRLSGERFRNRFGLESRRLVVSVARKSPTKRWDDLVRAVDLVNERLACTLVLVGPDEDRRPIASQNVLYVGEQDRAVVLDAYAAADVFALLSESESFGMAFLEAWMAGKPVVGNRRSGPVAELVDDGTDGFLCDGVLEAAERIAELLENPALARAFGEQGRRKVLARHTWTEIARVVSTLYDTLSPSGAHRTAREAVAEPT